MTLTLSTSCFLCPYKFPESIRTLQARTWQRNIHEMLRRIPDVVNRTFSPRDLDCDIMSVNGEDILEYYFDLISDQIEYYQKLREVPAILELAIYRGHGHAETDIVPHILSYL